MGGQVAERTWAHHEDVLRRQADELGVRCDREAEVATDPGTYSLGTLVERRHVVFRDGHS